MTKFRLQPRTALAAVMAAAAVAGAAFAASRGLFLHALFVATAGGSAAAALGPWAARRRWLLPLGFWLALSIPLVKHLGRGGGLPAIDADHVVLYPVDFVLVIIGAWLVARAGAAAGRFSFGAAARGLGALLRPDALGVAIIGLGVAAAVSAYGAPRPALAFVALADVARWYGTYVVFRALAAEGTGAVAGAFLAAAAAHALLCLVEFGAQSNFGLWEKPGFGAFVSTAPRLMREFFGVVRGGSTYESNVAAQFLQAALPFALVFGVGVARGGRRLLGFALVALVGAGAFVTFSRGGWLGAAAAYVVVLILMWRARRAWGTPWWALALLAAAAAVIVLPAAGILLVARALGPAQESSWWSRLADWRTALVIIRDHPLFGVGRGNYALVARLYNPWAFAYPVHNAYLLVWAETGALGLAFFLALWVGALRRGARLLRGASPGEVAFGAAAFAAFVGLALRQLVSMSFVHPFVSLTFLALAATAAAAARAARAPRG